MPPLNNFPSTERPKFLQSFSKEALAYFFPVKDPAQIS